MTAASGSRRQGTALASEVLGSGPSRVVLAHGFTQTRHAWGDLPRQLATGHTVVTVDLPGHGDSSAVGANVGQGARLIGDTCGVAHYVGYSMGGRHVLRLALDRPDLVRSAVLIGVHPGLEDAEERAARRAQDHARAERIETVGVAAFVNEWVQRPMFAGLPPEALDLPLRAGNSVAGLAASLRQAGTGAQEPMWSGLPGLRPPVLLVVGERDPKFTAIAERMVAVIGAGAQLVRIPDAGHAAHRERPDAFLRELLAWLTRQDGLDVTRS